VSHGRRNVRRAYLLGAAVLALASAWVFSRDGGDRAMPAIASRARAAAPAPAPVVLGAPSAPAPAVHPATPAHPAAVALAGRVITVDPGHNGGNFSHPSEIGRLVPDGNGKKECDTTGTAAPDGYRETDFNWSVARRLRALLLTAGARVVMTRPTNSGVGPCVDERAAIGNRAHSDVAISIHADGGPSGGSGFAILMPAAIPGGGDRAIIAPSRSFALDLRGALTVIGLHPSTYDGSDGLAPRTDLGGLNLSRVPKVFVEVGNMRNRPDEAPMETAAYRERVAGALRSAIERFLAGR
jgi:N-acetylmuramoyl-L-alanine amidase